jgi:hypothetical protein
MSEFSVGTKREGYGSLAGRHIVGGLLIKVQLTLPRFYRHPNKGENREIGGDHASKNPTSVY